LFIACLFDMRVLLALSPQESDGLLELTLDALGISFEYFQRLRSAKQFSGIQLLILDPDQPGQDFLLRYRRLYQLMGAIPLVVLGSRDHITMKMISWNPEQTVFLEGAHVLKRLESLLASRFQKSTPPSTSLAQVQARPAHAVELFQGLHGIQLADILQMLCLSRWTGEVQVHCARKELAGRLCIMNGEIHNAITQRHGAEEACYEMLGWKECEFRFLEKVQSFPRLIHAGWEALLMEAACRMDETAAAHMN